MSFRKIAVMAITALMLSSCGTITMRLGGKMDRRPISVKSKFYLLGLVGERSLIMKDYCANGVSRIEEEFTAGDVLVSILTVGIYTPRHSKLFCRI